MTVGHPSRPTAAALFCLVVVSGATIAFLRRSATWQSVEGPSVVDWAVPISPDRARVLLDRLKSVEPSREVAYDRVRDFGPPWIDVDHNGCDTRNDILARDLRAIAFAADDACIVVSGTLGDRYTGQMLPFTKSNATAIQIDHIVPLHAAWILGAWRWNADKRVAFANDPRNLVAVDGPSNQAKSDALADRWQPPLRRSRCAYAIATIDVHDAYELGVTGAERSALLHMLGTCVR